MREKYIKFIQKINLMRKDKNERKKVISYEIIKIQKKLKMNFIIFCYKLRNFYFFWKYFFNNAIEFVISF